MLLTVLGCSGSAPGPTGPASGYLVESEDAKLAVDLGNGTFASLQTHCDPLALDALLFSHLHPDHCADFTALTTFRRYHPNPSRDPRGRPLPVYAPAEAPSRLAAAYAPDTVARATTDLSDIYRFHPLSDDPRDIAGFRVTARLVAHPCEAYGFRIELRGRTLCYTGDSGPCLSLVELADGADVLLAEASWTDSADRPADLHLSGRQAGELAARSGVGRLLITHVPPWTDPTAVLGEARSSFNGPVSLAKPGATETI